MAHACYAAKARAGSYVPCTLSLGAGGRPVAEGYTNLVLYRVVLFACCTVLCGLCTLVLHASKRTVRMSCKPRGALPTPDVKALAKTQHGVWVDTIHTFWGRSCRR